MPVAPVVVQDPDTGIYVVRDDLYPGGTKARFFRQLFAETPGLHAVYASPAEGGAQTALAAAAADHGGKVTIFAASRNRVHPRAILAQTLGASYAYVTPGYLSVVQARAKEYAEQFGAHLLPFGAAGEEAEEAMAAAARLVPFVPDEVWCASGSGTLMRALTRAWPKAKRHAVQVGRTLSPEDVAGAQIWRAKQAFKETAKTFPPFPSDPHYDAKAWEFARTFGRVVRSNIPRPPGLKVLFWNVTGPA